MLEVAGDLLLKLVIQIGHRGTGGLQGDLFLHGIIKKPDQMWVPGLRPAILIHGGPGHWWEKGRHSIHPGLQGAAGCPRRPREGPSQGLQQAILENKCWLWRGNPGNRKRHLRGKEGPLAVSSLYLAWKVQERLVQLGPGEGVQGVWKALSVSLAILLAPITLTQPSTILELVHPRWVLVPALS